MLGQPPFDGEAMFKSALIDLAGVNGFDSVSIEGSAERGHRRVLTIVGFARKEQTLERALQRPHERETALHLLTLLADQAMLQKLFPVLIDLVSVGHSDIALCRTVIKSMSRAWVIAHIDEEVANILQHAGEEQTHCRAVC
jgi:hypothetical protein